MFKMSPYHHGFSKSKFSITNLVIYLDFITLILALRNKLMPRIVIQAMHSTLTLIYLLLHKSSAFGLSDGYVHRFDSYLCNWKSQIRVCAIFSSPFGFLFGVPQGSILKFLFCTVIIIDLCDAVAQSKYLYFADDIKIYRRLKKTIEPLNLLKTANLPQSDINCKHGWCTTNCMELDISKTKLISSRKTNLLIYEYKLCQSYTTRTASIQDLANISILLHFPNHVKHIFSRCIVTHRPIARRRPQYTHATIEQMLQEVFSIRVRAMPIAKQRLDKHLPTTKNTKQWRTSVAGQWMCLLYVVSTERI
jgi:hypothetical protein